MNQESTELYKKRLQDLKAIISAQQTLGEMVADFSRSLTEAGEHESTTKYMELVEIALCLCRGAQHYHAMGFELAVAARVMEEMKCL